MLHILMHMLTSGPFGPYVMAWGCALLAIAASARFRWAVLFVAVSVMLVLIGAVGIVLYFNGVRDASGDFVFEGPEFFGLVFLTVGSFVFAGAALLVAAVVAGLRHIVGACLAREQVAL